MKLIIPLTLLILSSCAQTVKPKSDVKKKEADSINTCVCMEIYAPVCGKDGKTYANSCLARCEKIRFTDGECR